MPIMKQYNGGTFGPGMTFPDNVLFENCVFLAQCSFGERCLFVNCQFKKCCPKPYSNPNSLVKQGSRLFNCSLEYVTIEKGSFLHECTNSGNRVKIQGVVNPPSKTETRGNTAAISSQTCAKCGNRINSLEAKKDNEFRDPCKVTQPTEGYSDVGVKRDECMCG